MKNGIVIDGESYELVEASEGCLDCCLYKSDFCVKAFFCPASSFPDAFEKVFKKVEDHTSSPLS